LSTSRELGTEGLGFAQRRPFERGDHGEGRAPIMQELFDRVRALHEPRVHRLEVQEELGDVLEELAPEHAIGHVVEGTARDVDHARAAAPADSVGHGQPTQETTAEEVAHAGRRPRKSIGARGGGRRR
jgi:hypothetical protein